MKPVAAAMADDGDKAGAGLKGRDPDATDFANYFCTYSFLYHRECLRGGALHV